tara:strand:+ start:527 stop:1372 length:846 start_codon:yes stop_codon:yes gene_type:complete
MIELRREKNSMLSTGFSGDTSNAMIYLQRCNRMIQTSYLSALGDDYYSKQIIDQWKREGVSTDQVSIIKDELPGIVLIENDIDGERRFFYWRKTSAFVLLMEKLPENFAWPKTEYIYLSGITIAATPEKHRMKLQDFVLEQKACGTKIVFDPNFRPLLWDAKTAIKEMMPYITSANWFLASEEDLEGLNLECSDVLKKNSSDNPEFIIRGEDGKITIYGKNKISEVATSRNKAVDTSGAGDAFNGTYLGCRLKGLSAENSAIQAHQTAKTVVMQKGAIVSN